LENYVQYEIAAREVLEPERLCPREFT